MTISGERTKQLDIFCHVTGFMSDFLSFIDAEFIRFFHGALQLILLSFQKTKLFTKLVYKLVKRCRALSNYKALT